MPYVSQLFSVSDLLKSLDNDLLDEMAKNLWKYATLFMPTAVNLRYQTIGHRDRGGKEQVVMELQVEITESQYELLVSMPKKLEEIGDQNDAHILIKPSDNGSDRRTVIIRGSDQNKSQLDMAVKAIMDLIRSINHQLMSGLAATKPSMN